jgi:hypothetical protein
VILAARQSFSQPAEDRHALDQAFHHALAVADRGLAFLHHFGEAAVDEAVLVAGGGAAFEGHLSLSHAIFCRN